jgi:predicted Zn-ribbon and HTH transcriptional regulator
MTKNLDEFIAKLLKDFSPKQQKVLAGRFGLKNGKRLTLQEIGEDLGVTRERVRQIEEQSLKKIRETVETEAKELLDTAKKFLSEQGGVRKDDVFMEEVASASGVAAKAQKEAKLRFVFAAARFPHFHKEDDSFNAFWYLDKGAEKKFLDFVKSATKYFDSVDRNEALREKKHLEDYSDPVSWHYLSIPKHFGVNVFGDFGPKHWAEIEPKTIRDKAYLALKKSEKPLHFEDIAKAIHSLKIDKKPAHVQTVHNELIKDERFVLVGRGVYALREEGYEPGTVREVIAKLLKAKGPMHASDVIRFVNERRFLKENTILLNLQNRKYFKRLDDGRYHSKEA